MADTPILYTCARSRGLRATWAAEEAGVDVDLKVLPFPPRYKAPEFKEINPLGTVPLLVHGDTRMTESCAIAVYLSGIGKPGELTVDPSEPDYGAFLDFTYHADATITFPQTVYMRFAVFEKDKGLEEAGHAYKTWFYKRLIKMEERLESREFLCGDRFTAADICCGYALYLAQNLKLDDGVPQPLKDYLARLMERPGFKRAFGREEAQLNALKDAGKA